MTRTLSTLIAASLLACGASHLPPAKVADTQSSISAAAAVGAEQHPTAALHLKMARDQLQEAQGLIDNGKDAQAKLVLERANADAELALMITREAEASAGVAKARSEIDALRNREH